MKLFRVLLIKNEIDIIKDNIEFHKDKSDGLIVIDNDSTDGTRDILCDYYNKGIINEIIDEPENNYNQYKWTTNASFVAKERYKATHCFSSDADEFWDIDRKKTEEAFYTHNVILCKFYNYLPENNIKFFDFDYQIQHKPFEDDKLSKAYNLFNVVNNIEHNNYKAIYSLDEFKQCWQGNHDVDIDNKKTTYSYENYIYHYPVRNYKQFKNKIIQGGSAYEKNKELDKNMGSHWRKLYEIYKNGNFKEEYDKIIGKNLNKQKLIEENIIKPNMSLGRFYK